MPRSIVDGPWLYLCTHGCDIVIRGFNDATNICKILNYKYSSLLLLYFSPHITHDEPEHNTRKKMLNTSTIN